MIFCDICFWSKPGRDRTDLFEILLSILLPLTLPPPNRCWNYRSLAFHRLWSQCCSSGRTIQIVRWLSWIGTNCILLENSLPSIPAPAALNTLLSAATSPFQACVWINLLLTIRSIICQIIVSQAQNKSLSKEKWAIFSASTHINKILNPFEQNHLDLF